MRPGTDNIVRDSRGRHIATLLASWYPTELSLQKAKKAYEKGCGGVVTIKGRSEASEK